MPKSKRAQVISLNKAKKKTKDSKMTLVEEIRGCIEEYKHVYVFSVENMRNTFLKDVREELKGKCRFFFGRNKVMAKALGTNEEEEVMPGTSAVAAKLSGSVGLLFTNMEMDDVIAYFDNYKQHDYARSGAIATETFVVPKGAVMRGDESFPSSMEPQLRRLGMPVTLVKGIVTLERDYTVCNEGDTLTPEQAQLLKHFYKYMAQFQVKLLCHWYNGEVKDLVEE